MEKAPTVRSEFQQGCFLVNPVVFFKKINFWQAKVNDSLCNKNYFWSLSLLKTVKLFGWCECLSKLLRQQKKRQPKLASSQIFDYLMQRANSVEKMLMLGKIEGKRRDWQRMRGLGIANISFCRNSALSSKFILASKQTTNKENTNIPKYLLRIYKLLGWPKNSFKFFCQM